MFSRSLILAGALASALVPVTAAPVRAADAADVAKIVGGIATLYIVGRAVSEARADDDDDDDDDREEVREARDERRYWNGYRYDRQGFEERGGHPGRDWHRDRRGEEGWRGREGRHERGHWSGRDGRGERDRWDEREGRDRWGDRDGRGHWDERRERDRWEERRERDRWDERRERRQRGDAWQGGDRQRQNALPASCQRAMRVRDQGLQYVLGPGCLARAGVYWRALPQGCRVSVQSPQGWRDAYHAHCLKTAGYRIRH